MSSSLEYRIINRFRDKLEDMRLQNQISRAQELAVLSSFDEIMSSIRAKNPYNIKNYYDAALMQFQPMKAMLEGNSFVDLIDQCMRLSSSISLFLLKLEDKEKTLNRMKLLTDSERVMRKTLLKCIKKNKSGLFKIVTYLAAQIKSLAAEHSIHL